MQNPEVDILINEANDLIKTAKEELSRSEEDVTSHLICHNARQAIINSLTYFLFKNGIEPNEPVTVESLLEQCKAEDGRFQLVKIKHIDCRNDEKSEEYCLSVAKVDSCFGTAQMIHGIVTGTSPGY